MKYFFICLVLLFKISFGTELDYSSPEIFPVHPEMKPAVNFWIDIYATYNTNQYVFHDSRHLDIIYEVVKVGEITGSDDPLTKGQKKYLKDKTKYYKDVLKAIAEVFPDSSKLNFEQKKVFRQLSIFKSKKDFSEASRRIRMQKGQKNKFKRGLEISGRYMPFLKKIFETYNLPQELTVLPHVESSFNYQAYSSAGAAGIWQFTRGTGKRYLKISYEIDERLDPLLATEAAAKLLSTNYRELGHWPLAITAYNHGLNGMKRAVKKQRSKDINKIIKNYRSRYFKFASRNFYTEFVAALHVVQNYQDYFGTIVFEQPIQYKEFELPRFLKYSTLKQYLDMDNKQFRTFNPALRPSVFNNSKYIPKGYRLRLPIHISADSLLTAIPEAAYLAEQKRSKYYKIRHGDTLSDIARRFGTSMELLLALNNISNAHYIKRGMTIRLPDKTDVMPTLALAPSPPKHQEKEDSIINPLMVNMPDQSKISGPFWIDTMSFTGQDSATQGINVAYNGGTDSSDLEIEFTQKENPAIGYIRVEPEETLGHYADWLQIKTQSVRNWNNLSFSSAIHLNQKIKLVFDKVSADDFNRIRLEYHRGIEEDFFMNYEITDTLLHKVKSGDNIWYLCNYEYNLPYWLIVDYNKDIDFESLKAGDKIVIPAIKVKN